MELTGCPVCAAREYSPVFQVTDLAYGTPGLFTLVRCTTCSVLYLKPRPATDGMEEYYPDRYEPFTRGIDQRPGLRNWLLRRRLRPRCQQVARLATAGRLLDVGCANGMFLAEMRRFGEWELHGVEPNAKAASYARERLGIAVAPRLETASYSSSYFDVVTLWDVIEHVHDPVATLIEIARILKPLGWLLISTPNAASLDARVFGRYWKGLDVPRHLTLFDSATMQRLLARCGLRPVRAYCYYGRYTVFALSVQLWLRDKVPAVGRWPLTERLLLMPPWRWLALPAFLLVEALGYGAILTYQAQRGDGE